MASLEEKKIYKPNLEKPGEILLDLLFVIIPCLVGGVVTLIGILIKEIYVVIAGIIVMLINSPIFYLQDLEGKYITEKQEKIIRITNIYLSIIKWIVNPIIISFIVSLFNDSSWKSFRNTLIIIELFMIIVSKYNELNDL